MVEDIGKDLLLGNCAKRGMGARRATGAYTVSGTSYLMGFVPVGDVYYFYCYYVCLCNIGRLVTELMEQKRP